MISCAARGFETKCCRISGVVTERGAMRRCRRAAPNAAIVEESRRNLIVAFPAFAGARIAKSCGGLIDSTPDAVPVIAPVQAVPGFFLMSGFSGHGFGIGPGSARLMTELVTGATPVVDPAPFRFERFG